MPERKRGPFLLVLFISYGAACNASAQEPGLEEQTIDTIRQLPQISVSDQRRIGDWVQSQLDKLTASAKESRQTAAAAFRTALKSQFDNANNSVPFKAQLAAQTAGLAASKFADPKLEPWVGYAVARVLADFDKVDTLPGLLAGLKSPLESVRYLCVKGLSSQKANLAAEKDKLDQTLAALREAGLVETSPVVLGRLYLALAYVNQVPAVFDVYLAIFEKRLTQRRAGTMTADGAEIEAWEFFRNPAVLGALNADQKAQLARPLAVFVRLDAERYGATGLDFYELDRLERSLEALESILAELAPGKGGKIRDELAAAGHDRCAEILAETAKWIGSAQSPEPGALNAPPFNVPPGAP